ncbi:MAG: peptidoglycan-binding protein [Acidimicrobiales bacterium]
MTATFRSLGCGDVGEPVRDLQRRLLRAGFDPGEWGLGEATGSALRRFQEQRGLRPDGQCGSHTWSALVEAGYRLGDRLLYVRVPILRGDDVSDLQTRLGQLGFFDERVDGMYGPLTAQGLVDFQRNTGLSTDGICGPESIAALVRLGGRSAQGVKGRLVERERLMAAPRRLLRRRVMIGDVGGLGALASAVVRALHQQGAVVVACAEPEQSAQAAEANRFGAEVYLGLGLRPSAGGSCSYYATAGFVSAGGQRLARVAADALVGPLGASVGTHGMQLPVLRETRMTAIWCELGSPSLVVEVTQPLAEALAKAVSTWAAAPVEQGRER